MLAVGIAKENFRDATWKRCPRTSSTAALKRFASFNIILTRKQLENLKWLALVKTLTSLLSTRCKCPIKMMRLLAHKSLNPNTHPNGLCRTLPTKTVRGFIEVHLVQAQICSRSLASNKCCSKLLCLVLVLLRHWTSCSIYNHASVRPPSLRFWCSAGVHAN